MDATYEDCCLKLTSPSLFGDSLLESYPALQFELGDNKIYVQCDHPDVICLSPFWFIISCLLHVHQTVTLIHPHKAQLT